MQGTLARRLRVLRAERGWTLREAEGATGVDKGTISKLERGVRHPHDITLSRIAKAYEVSVEDLLEEPVAAGKAEAPEEEAGQASEERRIIESLLRPWIRWFERDADYLEWLKRARKVATLGINDYEKILDDRQLAVEALDGVADALKKGFGIDLNDLKTRVRNPAVRPAFYELQRAFVPWSRVSVEVGVEYRARVHGLDARARDEEKKRMEESLTPQILQDDAA